MNLICAGGLRSVSKCRSHTSDHEYAGNDRDILRHSTAHRQSHRLRQTVQNGRRTRPDPSSIVRLRYETFRLFVGSLPVSFHETHEDSLRPRPKTLPSGHGPRWEHTSTWHVRSHSFDMIGSSNSKLAKDFFTSSGASSSTVLIWLKTSSDNSPRPATRYCGDRFVQPRQNRGRRYGSELRRNSVETLQSPHVDAQPRISRVSSSPCRGFCPFFHVFFEA